MLRCTKSCSCAYNAFWRKLGRELKTDHCKEMKTSCHRRTFLQFVQILWSMGEQLMLLHRKNSRHVKLYACSCRLIESVFRYTHYTGYCSLIPGSLETESKYSKTSLLRVNFNYSACKCMKVHVLFTWLQCIWSHISLFCSLKWFTY